MGIYPLVGFRGAVIFAIVAMTAGSSAFAQQRDRSYPPKLEGAVKETYKQVGDVQLDLWVVSPAGTKAGDKRAAIVFFFGGGWRSGTPAQFKQQCEYLAARGMVAITADYRVAARHQVKAVSCVEDAKSAIRWVRTNAQRLGVDPERIVAAGGSAGGHLAACTGVIQGFEAADEDASVSSVPNAMALFNPAVMLVSFDETEPFSADRIEGIQARMGIEPQKLSPIHHVRAKLPPTIIFHGTNDQTVKFRTVELFTKAMKSAGNRCVLVPAEGQGHGYFNAGRDNTNFRETMAALDQFLVELGYLSPSKT